MSVTHPTSVREAATGVAPAGDGTTTVARRPRPPRRTEGQGGLFRLEVGFHVGDGPPGCECDDCAKDAAYMEGRRPCGSNHVYRQRFVRKSKEFDVDPPEYSGDLVRSDQDLVALHGPKFSRVLPATQGGPYLSPMDQQPGETTEQYARRLSDLAARITGEAVRPGPRVELDAEKPTAAVPQPAATANKGLPAATAQAQSGRPDFDKMGAAALKQWADDHEVDLGAARTRDDMLRVLRQAK